MVCVCPVNPTLVYRFDSGGEHVVLWQRGEKMTVENKNKEFHVCLYCGFSRRISDVTWEEFVALHKPFCIPQKNHEILKKNK